MSIIKRIGLPFQLLIALVLAIIFGKFVSVADSFYNFFGTTFINAITMVILPLIFPVVIVAVVKIFNEKSFGRILAKTFIYFFVVTTAIIAIFLLASYYLKFGSSTHATANASSLKGIGTSVNLWTFLTSIVPENVVKAFSTNNLLSVIFFAIAIGLGLGAYGPDKSEPLLHLFDIWINALYKVTDFIIKLSPIGIFGIIAHDVSTVGINELLSLVKFIIGLYIGYAL